MENRLGVNRKPLESGGFFPISELTMGVGLEEGDSTRPMKSPTVRKASSSMKIHGRKTHQMGAIGPMGAPASVEETPEAQAPVSVGDQVDLSSTQQLRQLACAVQAMPTVRVDKVEGLRSAIEEGNYYVESEKLARKVVDEAIQEAIFRRLNDTDPH